MARKIYVDTIVKFNKNGNMIPLAIIWEDGARYDIEKVTDARNAASLKAGGVGLRFTCLVNNRETYLFLEEDRWFVEEK